MASGEQRGSHFFHSFTIHNDDDDDDYFGALFSLGSLFLASSTKF